MPIRLTESTDRSRALQAFLLALPIVNRAGMRGSFWLTDLGVSGPDKDQGGRDEGSLLVFDEPSGATALHDAREYEERP